MALIARLGDSSSHGGTIITCAAVTKTEGILTARVGDLHSCPIPGHGITPITNGSGNFKTEGMITAVSGSICGCGAVIIAGSSVSNAPLESPSGAGKLGPVAGEAPKVLGPWPTDEFIMG